MKTNSIIKQILLYTAVIGIMIGCTVASKLEKQYITPKVSHTSKALRDKVKFEEDRKSQQMFAVADSSGGGSGELMFRDSTNTVVEDGEEMMKIDIESISVKARSRTLPERNGMVEIDFLIMLPASLQGETQSLTITPFLLSSNGTKEELEPLQVRGGLFSKLQERNYWRFAKFRDMLQQQYNYGPMSPQDSAHLKRVFEEYVRYPYLDNARLDSVSKGKDLLTYHYRQSIKVEKDIKRMEILVEGNVKALDGSVYILPVEDTLQFMLSSMLAFVDDTERYLTRIVSKYAFVRDRNHLQFKLNNVNIIDTLGDNSAQLEKISSLMYNLLFDSEYHVDSIVLTATSSPEGSFAINTRLARERAHSLARYLRNKFDFPEMDTLIKVKWIGEDWEEFAIAMSRHRDKIKNYDKILNIIHSEGNKDVLEAKIRREYPSDYNYIKANIYPQLRAVNFKYDLRRAGMVQDTIHTLELDTAYMRGVELLRQRDYQGAHELIFSARTQNSAVALLSLGHNRSAYEILLEQPSTADVEYLKAIVCSRLGMDDEGREYFFKACEINPRLEFRGRLDPEITAIIDFDKLQMN